MKEGVFPGGVLLIARESEIIGLFPAGRTGYEPQDNDVTPDTVYDLASLTKILSTTFLTMLLVDEGRLSLDDDPAGLLGLETPADKAGLTMKTLLSHSSGLPAWRPLYETLEKLPRENRRAAAVKVILGEPLENPPGRWAVYSDLGFILLGFILEKLLDMRQDRAFGQLIARPLGLTKTGYRPLDAPQAGPPAAPTENAPRRGGVIRGMVHDDNAFALGGAAGHAGLFGPAREAFLVFDNLARAFRGQTAVIPVSQDTVRTFWARTGRPPGSTWALGFDTPAETGSSAGEILSRQSVGHLGYTGTSLWHDPARTLTVILLTNRVHPSAENIAIRRFRPHIHDAAAAWEEGRIIGTF